MKKWLARTAMILGGTVLGWIATAMNPSIQMGGNSRPPAWLEPLLEKIGSGEIHVRSNRVETDSPRVRVTRIEDHDPGEVDGDREHVPQRWYPGYHIWKMFQRN